MRARMAMCSTYIGYDCFWYLCAHVALSPQLLQESRTSAPTSIGYSHGFRHGLVCVSHLCVCVCISCMYNVYMGVHEFHMYIYVFVSRQVEAHSFRDINKQRGVDSEDRQTETFLADRKLLMFVKHIYRTYGNICWENLCYQIRGSHISTLQFY